MKLRLTAAIAVAAALAGPAAAQQIEVEEFVLDNGMKFLLYPRSEQPNNIAAGWVAKVGSVNERPGITGLSHFFEHMMFKGTNTIGTTDATQDASFRRKQSEARQEFLDVMYKDQYPRYFRGEIDDPWNPENDSDTLRELRGSLQKLMDEQKEVTTKNEFDRLYTNDGGSGMNAFTTNDHTFYFINVPSNKFELWAWMESDRLDDSVFREFYAERDVVHEERRLRVDSTPTGKIDEQYDSMFWQSSPYSWPVIGWPSDLEGLTREEALSFFDVYYAPNNLTAALVGRHGARRAFQIMLALAGIGAVLFGLGHPAWLLAGAVLIGVGLSNLGGTGVGSGGDADLPCRWAHGIGHYCSSSSFSGTTEFTFEKKHSIDRKSVV